MIEKSRLVPMDFWLKKFYTEKENIETWTSSTLARVNPWKSGSNTLFNRSAIVCGQLLSEPFFFVERIRFEKETVVMRRWESETLKLGLK